MAASASACTSASSTPAETTAPSVEADPTPLASIPALEGVDTQVTLVDGALHFPITGGNVDYYDPKADYRPYVQGEIDHDGSGITLTGGDTVVGLSDFKIDPGTSRLTGTVTANGELAAKDVFIFNLDGSTLKPLTTDANGDAVLEGTRVLIGTDAAALLNKTFNTDAVTDTLLVGIAKITAHAK